MKHVVASLRDANPLRLGETQLRNPLRFGETQLRDPLRFGETQLRDPLRFGETQLRDPLRLGETQLRERRNFLQLFHYEVSEFEFSIRLRYVTARRSASNELGF